MSNADLTIVFDDKDVLVEALKKRLPELRRIDREAVANHKAAEKKALDDYRDVLRTKLKMTYAQLTDDYGKWNVSLERPSCPTLLAKQCERAISQLETSAQKKFTVAPGGSFSNLHKFLTWDPDFTAAVC